MTALRRTSISLLAFLQSLMLLILVTTADGAAAKVPTARPQTVGNGGTISQIPINYGKLAPGRTGWYYLPKGYKTRRVPVMVALHGAGGDGRDMIGAFQGLAEQYGFVIIAPQSHDLRGWLAQQDSGSLLPKTDDSKHVEACWQWVLKHRPIRVDKTHVTTVGFSAGGFSAGQYASNGIYTGLRFTHAMAIHSQFDPYRLGQIKPYYPKLWLSTGKNDGPFPPSQVESVALYLRALGWNVTYKVTYPNGHDLGNKAELTAAVRWWLGK